MNPSFESWLAGKVVRKHGMQTVHRENIAEHTWGVVHTLIHWYNGKPPVNVIIKAEYHDLGEAGPGDVPAYVKWDNPTVAETFERLEDEKSKELLSPAVYEACVVSVLEDFIIEMADRLEFCFSQLHEIKLGNSYAEKPFRNSMTRVIQKMEACRKLIPWELASNIEETINYIQKELALVLR